MLIVRRGMATKCVAVLTTACFLLSAVFEQPLSAASVDMRVAQTSSALTSHKSIIELPYSTGRVTDNAANGAAPVIVAIQDLHCHGDVQRSIASILAALEKRYGISSIYVEGASGNVDVSWENALTDKGGKERILQTLLDDGRLTGAEYYAITSGNKVLLKGIENEEQYASNLDRLNTIVTNRDVYERELDAARPEIDRINRLYLSGRNRVFRKYIDAARNAEKDPAKYYRLLERYAAECSVPLSSYPNLTLLYRIQNLQRGLNYQSIASQTRTFISLLKEQLPYFEYEQVTALIGKSDQQEAVYVHIAALAERTGLDRDLPQLHDFLSYIRANQSINPVALAREELALQYAVEQRLAQSDAEREALFIGRFLSLLNDYFHARVSAEDNAYVDSHWDEFALLWNKYTDMAFAAAFRDGRALLREYYRVNDQRNATFVAGIPEASQSRSFSPPATKVAVIITGGYHTAGLAQIFRSRKLPYLVITPNVGSDTSIAQRIYERIVKDGADIDANALALRLYSTIINSSADTASIRSQIFRTFVGSSITAALSRYSQQGSLADLANELNTEFALIERATGLPAGKAVYDQERDVVHYTSSVDAPAEMILSRDSRNSQITISSTNLEADHPAPSPHRGVVALCVMLFNSFLFRPLAERIFLSMMQRRTQPTDGIVDRVFNLLSRMPLLFAQEGMAVAVVPNDEFAARSADEVAKTIRHLQGTNKRDVNLVLAAGNTMRGFLHELSRHEDINWQRIRFFQLTEYDGLQADDTSSSAYFHKSNLFGLLSDRGIDISSSKKYFIGGENTDCTWYMERLRSLGGADIVVAGIGPRDDGHIGFNMPGTPFDSVMRKVQLESTVTEANKNDYPGIESRPFAYTMGIADILEAKYVYSLARGPTKKEIVKDFLNGPISLAVPVTALRTKNEHVTVILDQDAAQDLSLNRFVAKIRYLLHFLGHGNAITDEPETDSAIVQPEPRSPEYIQLLNIISGHYLELSHKSISRDADVEIRNDRAIVDELKKNESQAIDLCVEILRNEPEPWVRAKTVVLLGELADTQVNSVIDILVGGASIDDSLLVKSLIIRKVIPDLMKRSSLAPETQERVMRELAAISLSPWRKDSYRILDIGCQYGEPVHGMLRYFREIEKIDDVQVVGIDPDIRAIIEADRMRPTRNNPDDAVFMYGIASENPQSYRTGPADMVFSMNLLVYSDEIKKHLEAIATECAPGGIIYFTPSIWNTYADSSGEDGLGRLSRMQHEMTRMQPPRMIVTEYTYRPKRFPTDKDPQMDPFNYSKHFPRTNVFGSPWGDSAGWASAEHFSVTCDGKPLRIRTDKFPDGEHKLRIANVSLLEQASEITLTHPIENASDYVAISLLLNMIRLYAPKGVKVRLEIDRQATTDQISVFLPLCQEVYSAGKYSRQRIELPEEPVLIKKSAPLAIDMMLCQHQRLVDDTRNAAQKLNVPYATVQLDKSRQNPLDWSVSLPANIQGKNIMLVHSCENATDISELWLILTKLRRADVGSITLINSYEGYSRQDKLFAQGEGINAIALLSSIDKYVDVHMALNLHYGDGTGMMVKGNEKLGFYQIINLNAFVQVAEKLFDRFAACVGDANIVSELDKHPLLLMSPDKGSIKRVRAIVPVLRKYIQKYIREHNGVTVPLDDIPVVSGYLGKKRISGTKVIVTGPVRALGPNGNEIELTSFNKVRISDAWAFIVDDEAAYGSTQLSAVYCLHESIGIHPLRIMAGVVHGKLTAGYAPFDIGMSPERATALLKFYENPIRNESMQDLKHQIHRTMKYDPAKAQMAPVELVATESVDLQGKLPRPEQLVNIDRLFVYAAELLATAGIYGTTGEDNSVVNKGQPSVAKSPSAGKPVTDALSDDAQGADAGWEDEPLLQRRVNKRARTAQSILSWLSDPVEIGPRFETALFPAISTILLMGDHGGFISIGAILWATVGFSLFHVFREWYQRALALPMIDHLLNANVDSADIGAFLKSPTLYETVCYQFDRGPDLAVNIQDAMEQEGERGNRYILIRVDNELTLYRTNGRLIIQTVVPQTLNHRTEYVRAAHPRYWFVNFLKRSFLGGVYGAPFIATLFLPHLQSDILFSVAALTAAWIVGTTMHSQFNVFRTLADATGKTTIPTWVQRILAWFPLTTIFNTPPPADGQRRPFAWSKRSAHYGATAFMAFKKLSESERVDRLARGTQESDLHPSRNGMRKTTLFETAIFPGIGIGAAVLFSLSPALSALGIMWATLVFSIAHTFSEWITRAQTVKLLRILGDGNNVDDRLVGKTEIVFTPANSGGQLPHSYPSSNGAYTIVISYAAKTVSMALFTPSGIMVQGAGMRPKTASIDEIDLSYDPQDLVLVRQPRFWVREFFGRLAASFIFAVPFAPALIAAMIPVVPCVIIAAKFWILPAIFASYAIHAVLNDALSRAASPDSDQYLSRLPAFLRKYLFVMRHAPMSAMKKGSLTPEQKALLDTLQNDTGNAVDQQALMAIFDAHPADVQDAIDHITKNRILGARKPMLERFKLLKPDQNYLASVLAEGLANLQAKSAAPYLLRYLVTSLQNDPSLVLGYENNFSRVARAFVILGNADDTVFNLIKLTLDREAFLDAATNGRLKDPNLHKLIERANKHSFYRLSMITALEESRNPLAGPVLSKLCHDEQLPIRKAAERALSRYSRVEAYKFSAEKEALELWVKLENNGARFNVRLPHTLEAMYPILVRMGEAVLPAIVKTMQETPRSSNAFSRVLKPAYDDIKSGKSLMVEAESEGLPTADGGKLFTLGRGFTQNFQRGMLKVLPNAVEYTHIGKILRVEPMSMRNRITFYDSSIITDNVISKSVTVIRQYNVPKDALLQVLVNDTDAQVTFVVPQSVVNSLRYEKGYAYVEPGDTIKVDVTDGTQQIECIFTARPPALQPSDPSQDSLHGGATWIEDIDYTLQKAWWAERLISVSAGLLAAFLFSSIYPADLGPDKMQLFTIGIAMLVSAITFFAPHVINRGIRKSLSSHIVGMSALTALTVLPFSLALCHPASALIYGAVGSALYCVGTLIQRKIDLAAAADTQMVIILSNILHATDTHDALTRCYNRQFWMDILHCTDTEAGRMVDRFCDLAEIVSLNDNDSDALVTQKVAHMIFVLRSGTHRPKGLSSALWYAMFADLLPFVNIQDMVNGKHVRETFMKALNAFRLTREPYLEFIDATPASVSSYMPRPGFTPVFVEILPANATAGAFDWVDLNRISKVDALIDGQRVLCNIWAHKESVNGQSAWVVSCAYPGKASLENDGARNKGAILLAVKELFDANPVVKEKLGLGVAWDDRIFLRRSAGLVQQAAPGIIRSENPWADAHKTYAEIPSRLTRHQSTVFEVAQDAESSVTPQGGLQRRVAELHQQFIRRGVNVALMRDGDSLAPQSDVLTFTDSLIASHQSMPFDTILLSFKEAALIGQKLGLWQSMNSQLTYEGLTALADIAYDPVRTSEQVNSTVLSVVNAGFGGIVLHFNGNEALSGIERQVAFSRAVGPDLQICIRIDNAGYDYQQLAPMAKRYGAVLMLDMAASSGRIASKQALIESLRSQGIPVFYAVSADSARSLPDSSGAIDISRELSLSQPWGIAIPDANAVSKSAGFDPRVWNEQILSVITERLAAVIKSTENSFESAYRFAWALPSGVGSISDPVMAVECRSVIQLYTLWKQDQKNEAARTRLLAGLQRVAASLKTTGPDWSIPATYFSNEVTRGNLDAASGFLRGLFTMVLYKEHSSESLTFTAFSHRKMFGETLLELQQLYGERDYARESPVKRYRALYAAYHSAFVPDEGDITKVDQVIAPIDRASSTLSVISVAEMCSDALAKLDTLRADAEGISESAFLDARLRLLVMYAAKTETVDIKKNTRGIIVINVKKILGAA